MSFLASYSLLFFAIITEILATSALKFSYGLSKLVPSIIVLVCYTLSFLALSITLKTLPVGVVYAIWSGLGILGISLIAVFYFQETFGLMHLLGMIFILAGVLILTLLTSAEA